MLHLPHRALFGAHFVRRLAQLTRLYWTSPDARRGALLLALAVAFELATVYGAFVLAEAQRRIYDGLQDRAPAAFFSGVALFAGAVLGFVLVSTYRIYVRQALEIRWRTWLTDHLLAQWITPHACSQMEAVRADADNPDQRIAEDVRNYVASALGLSLSLLAALVTLVSFSGLLWRMSSDWPVQIGGVHFDVPGFMMWVAFAYAAIASWITHRVGRPLVPINFDRLRFEADFRFGLVRFRENAEAIGLAGGEIFEQESAVARFQAHRRKLVASDPRAAEPHAAHDGHRSAERSRPAARRGAGLLPRQPDAGPRRAGRDRLRPGLGRAGVVRERLSGDRAVARERRAPAHLHRRARGRANPAQRGRRAVRDPSARDALEIEDLRLSLPDGRTLLEGGSASVAPGERVAVVGPTGAGQTTLFRALAGRWPFGAGHIAMPPAAETMFLSPQPYLPIASLRAVLSYPGPETTFSDEKIREALKLVGLDYLAGSSTRPTTGRSACRAASSSGSRSLACCCTSRAGCSSTTRPPRSTRTPSAASTRCSQSGCRARR